MRSQQFNWAWLAAPLLIALAGCDDDDAHFHCSNDECVCNEGQRCDIACDSPPCHVLCEQDSKCAATCGNGDCLCEKGSRCDFDCHSPPCHVTCDSETQCSGVCANGTCTCAAGSECHFECQDNNCHTHCQGDAPCTLRCPTGRGGQGCRIDTCSAPVLECPDGVTLACNMPCPEADDSI